MTNSNLTVAKATEKTLTFIYPNLAPSISTDIGEIETYSNNLVVAPAIGNLVTYFSDERPTPYLAESWYNENNLWIFKIRTGLACEDGEPITAENFVRSLKTSIKIYSRNGKHPIFGKLRGYNNFINGKSAELEGLYFDDRKLIFNFAEKVRGGFLEHLTMAPFGYLCSNNFINGEWKDQSKIISSGPFSLMKIENHDEYTLKRRSDWPSEFAGGPKFVKISRGSKNYFDSVSGPKIFEHLDVTEEHLNQYKHIRQTPQNLVVVKLNLESQVFSDVYNRRIFLKNFKKNLSNVTPNSSVFQKTDHFFFNSSLKKKVDLDTKNYVPAQHHVKLKVMLKGDNSPNNINRDIILKTVSDLGWSIEVDSQPYNSFITEFRSNRFDIFVESAEVGGGFEGWIIDMLFCSDVGNRWPDPSARICKLTKDFNETDLTEQAADQQFHEYLSEDAALIPTFHRGGYYLLSSEINTKSMSPLVTRIRFEEIEIED